MTVTWAGRRVEEDVALIVDESADEHAVPRRIVRAIVVAESDGDPLALGDYVDGVPLSAGLLQGYTGERGQAHGYTVEELQDPEFNMRLLMPPIARAYRSGRAQGLTGADLVRHVAGVSGHPGNPAYIENDDVRRAALRSIERIVTIWRDLDDEAPAAAAATPDAGPSRELAAAARPTVTMRPLWGGPPPPWIAAAADAVIAIATAAWRRVRGAW